MTVSLGRVLVLLVRGYHGSCVRPLSVNCPLAACHVTAAGDGPGEDCCLACDATVRVYVYVYVFVYVYVYVFVCLCPSTLRSGALD